VTYVIGIDPGPVCGVVGLWIEDRKMQRADVVQCSAGCLRRVLSGLWLKTGRIAMERYVLSRRGGRLNDAAASKTTRAVIDMVTDWAEVKRTPCVLRSAAEVKPWATDQRQLAAGLLKVTTGMPHARDAARHALFAAVHDCGMRDPLSKRGGVA
jgi:hypothetical protein